MSDDMRTRLTDFAAEFLTDAEAEQRLKEVFEKYMGTARVGSITSGSIKLDVANQPAMKIEINRNDRVGGHNENNGTVVVQLDLLEPTFFSVSDDRTGIFDKLRTATEFAQN
jgi:hypothetical protein